MNGLARSRTLAAPSVGTSSTAPAPSLWNLEAGQKSGGVAAAVSNDASREARHGSGARLVGPGGRRQKKAGLVAVSVQKRRRRGSARPQRSGCGCCCGGGCNGTCPTWRHSSSGSSGSSRPTAAALRTPAAAAPHNQARVSSSAQVPRHKTNMLALHFTMNKLKGNQLTRPG